MRPKGTAGAFLPFSAVVGQEDAKLALLLCAVDPGIRGVLLRGDKGSAKTTLARGFAALLAGDARFVELPVGATEDRLLGTLDIASALVGGEVRFSPGLLAAAHGGVLYVDEINLLADHLVDALLDVAASGVNRVERDGISHSHPASFVLVGSMNPEEGELRPQLLDRFGLSVEVRTPLDAAERVEALTRRLAFDDDPEGVEDAYRSEEIELAARVAAARPARLRRELVEAIAELCASLGAQGLRADLALCRGSAALAGLEGRAEVEVDDVARVAVFALAHRGHQDPLADPSYARESIDNAVREHLGSSDGSDELAGEDQVEVSEASGHGDEDGDGDGDGDEDGGDRDGGGGSRRDPVEGRETRRPALEQAVASVTGSRSVRPAASAAGRRGPAPANRGRVVADRRPDGPVQSVAVVATVRAAVARRASVDGVGPLVEVSDVREAVRETRRAHLIVFAVDASGSMGAPTRVEAAKSAVLSLLRDAYERRDRVAMVSFRGESAEVLLAPTGSVEVARARLASIGTGGRTPLAEGIRAALAIATARRPGAEYAPLLVVVTDGRATFSARGNDPWNDAEAAAAQVASAGVPSIVVDVEDVEGHTSKVRLGLASRLAQRMGAACVAIDAMSADALLAVVKGARGAPGGASR